MNRFNKKDIRHGYWEFKHFLTFNGKPWRKFTYNNRTPLGYEGRYYENGKIGYKQINI